MSTPSLSAPGDSGPAVEAITEVRRKEALLKTGALQNAILNSANFSIIATDEKGVIQLFNIGAETMLGYAAVEVVDRITPADIHDPQEVIQRAQALSLELATTIAPGFEALAFKASRGIEDKYELTYIRKDGSRFPAIVSVTALRDGEGRIIGYLLIGTDNSARKQVEEKLRWTEEGFRLMVESVTDCAIVMLDYRSGENQGLPRRGDRRPALLPLLSSAGYRARCAAARPRLGGSGGTIRGRGLARAKGWLNLLGERRLHGHSRSSGQCAWIREADPRFDRAQAGRGNADQGQGCGGEGQPRQVQFPFQHEP